MSRAVGALVTLCFAACAGGAPQRPESAAPVVASAERAEPEPVPIESDAFVAPDAAANTHATDEPDAAPASECRPRGPALPVAVCPNDRLAARLAELGSADPGFEGFVRCEPLAVEDLERVTPVAGRAGDLDAGPAFFGSDDVNRDGQRDLVLLYTSVDYWSWFVFVKAGSCMKFVDAVDGYQVELLPKLHQKLPELAVFTYPLQGKLETRRFDGTRYQLQRP